MVSSATMSKLTTIHQNKQPIRRHYLAEWLEDKDMSPTELLELLNDPERSSEYPYIDKSQVYRWLKGQLPQPAMQMRIAAALGFEGEPERLLQPPEFGWMKDFFEGRTREEVKRIRNTLSAAFPRDDATDGNSDQAEFSEEILQRLKGPIEKHVEQARRSGSGRKRRSG